MAKNDKFLYFWHTLPVLLFFFNIWPLAAQEAQNPFLEEEAIRKLKSGTLLVRLESLEKKLQFLERSMEHAECDASCKKKIQEDIEEVRLARNQFNKEFITAFRTYFSFCKVYFYYDNQHSVLLQKRFADFSFIGDSLNELPPTTVSKDSILILKKDLTPDAENEGWLFQTTDGFTMKSKFPFITENNAKTLINRLASSDYLKKNCRYMVKKLNKDLFKFYWKTEEKRLEGRKEFERMQEKQP